LAALGADRSLKSLFHRKLLPASAGCSTNTNDILVTLKVMDGYSPDVARTAIFSSFGCESPQIVLLFSVVGPFKL
jgi:hypothetical protein